MTEIHTRIFSVSQRLFAERGYAGVSISDIATDAGIAKSTVLHHFPNKQKLYEAVVAESLDKFSTLKQEITADETQTLAERLQSLLQWMLAEPRHAKLLNRVFMDNPRTAAMAARKYWNPLLNHLVALDSNKEDQAEMRARILFCTSAIFQIAFSIELQQQLLVKKRDGNDLSTQYQGAIQALVSAILPARASVL